VTINSALALSTAQQSSSWDTLIGVGIVLLIIAGLWLLNRVIKHYFPSTRKRHAIIGNALMRVEAAFLPGREHITEAMERDDEDADEQSGPPETGKPRS
jgi:hypothetical protein